MIRSLKLSVAVSLLLPWALLSCLPADLCADERLTPQERSHWAFQPLNNQQIPEVRQKDLVRNPIDAFLLACLEQDALSFSPPASRRELVRRAAFDLTGLPPTPNEIADFLADDSPDAYERLIDRLLTSPHYGEHWGRHWLDVVRYAETAGYNADPLRPLAWKYRDYVIRAMNNDTPYDRFVQEQLAGDELFPESDQGVLATGYTLLWPDESNASNILLARQDSLNDLTANVGSVFLGLSIGCAQCHDHKFDPLPQRDFYRLQAFFSGIVRSDSAPIGTTSQIAAYKQELARWLNETAALRDALHQLEHPARVKAAGDRRMKFPDVVLAAIDTVPERRTAYQRQLAFWSERQMEIKEESLAASLSDDQKKRRAELQAQLAACERTKPQPPTEVAGMIVGELESVPPVTHFLAAGSYDKPLDEVLPGFLSVLDPNGNADAEVISPRPYTSGRRSALARWLTSPDNPLTPRVIVNRIWQGHFGKGLVENANDFGTQTPPPSHPELLDWLAREFVSPSLSKEGPGGSDKNVSAAAIPVPEPRSATPPNPPLRRGENGIAWSMKSLHRLIMTSAAYRQSTDRHAGAAQQLRANEVDPSNRLYWHFDRRRLPAESIRDAFLSVAGRLNGTVYGPSVYPELPPDFSKREAWKVSSNPADRLRRSVYIHAKRNLPYPLLEAFDLPDLNESCARRTQTTVAPQALMLLNSDIVLEFARAFAGRLLHRNPHADLRPLVAEAYSLAFSREASDDEIGAGENFILRQQSLIESERVGGHSILLPRGFPKFLDPPLAAALVDFCHALLNTNEFVYVE